MKYLPGDEERDPTEGERELEGVLDLVQPGWRERVVVRRFLPNMVASNAIVPASHRRPAVDAPRVPGVFLAGDWIESDAMLSDAAIASARVAAQRALDFARVSGSEAQHRKAAPAATLGAP
jgi:hypothetical protein